MIKAYDEGYLVGYFHEGMFIPDPGQLILELRFMQSECRDLIKKYERMIQSLRDPKRI